MLMSRMALEPAKLSDFKLAGALGSGATATVYEATHLPTGRAVAIKLMAEAGQNAEMRERFAREALLLADVDSRHVAKIVGFGFDKGQPFLVLERLHGETLDAKLRRDGPVVMAVAARWVEQLIVGVRDCHDSKVIHRDIKPSNIFLHRGDDSGETVKLIDFGVARLREIAGDSGLTSASHVLGSMGYMAPEQFQSAKSVGFPADLYAVGVVIFRMLSGRLPFVSRSLAAVIRMKTEQAVPPISSMMPGTIKNPLLDWFVAKSMVREPEARFQSAREMLEHWWNVMASLDGEGSEAVRRMNEPHTGRRLDTRPPIPLPSQYANTRPMSAREHSADQDAYAPRAPATAPPPEHTAEQAIEQSVAAGVDDVGPITLPGGPPISDSENTRKTVPGFDPAAIEEVDPFELPTRTDPSLRKLVERELELHRARFRDGD
jgi:serine/threonine-protein kinase